MKKLLSFLVLSCLLTFGYSQSQRLVLLEEFTSATCGPCVSKNTTFYNWQIQNPGKFTSIYYHVNWPSPGDPMNLANPQEVGARVNMYMPASSHYVPYSVLDGNYHNGNSAGWNMTTVNNRWAMPSPFEIQLQHKLSAGLDSVYSTMLVKCTQNITASMTAHNVVIEKHIHFNSAPCANSNGERDFYWVMKKMLPGSNGTTIPGTMVVGDYVLLEGAWKFGTVYDPNEIASVGFVQDKSSEEVYQTANSSVDALVLPYNNDLQVMEIQNVPAKTCINKISPKVVVRNNGKLAVTSLTIKYKVNEGTLNTFTWTGSLTSMKKQTITLPEIGFAILPQNILTVYSTSPNSVADEYPKNDTLEFAIVPAPISTDQIKLVLRTDNAPQETTWEFKGSAGNVVATGGPYTVANQINQQTITMPQADCYTFTIFDTGGNGICCSNGTGVYEISSNSITIKQGGQFGSSESSEFWMEAPVSVIEQVSNTSLSVNPNPINGSSTVNFSLPGTSEVSISLLTALGQPVLSKTLGTLDGGSHTTILDASHLNTGVYILQLKTTRGIYSRKVSVIK